MRRAARRDNNEDAIVQALRASGWSVAFLSGAGTPDLVIGRPGALLLVEVKAKNGKLTPDQEQWHREWRGAKPVIVRSVDEALKLEPFTRHTTGE